MKNPGLGTFSYIKSPNHPLNIDPLEDDPHLESGENDSDYMPPIGFGRWRNPGQSLRVPIHQGPPYKSEESPEDVVHGEFVSPVEQESADHILRGEHESDKPSANTHVEHARLELQTPSSVDAVGTLSGLLRGARPRDVGGIDEAHDYLSKHFTGVRVNPRHGTLVAVSPTGQQLVKRKLNLPAVPDQQPKTEQSPASYTLTNKHGVFRAQDPKRLVRAMVAFQIVHNEIAQSQQNKKEKDDDQDGLTSTSGIRDIFYGISDGVNRAADFVSDGLRAAIAPKQGPGNDRYTSLARRDPIVDEKGVPYRFSSVKSNDLCPVCVSGYLEPYDDDTHECLNCGSLAKHVGFEKKGASKPRGGLGRGLGQILEPVGDPLNLASGGSENPDNAVAEDTQEEFAHPLADEELDPDYVGYQAPRNILDKMAGEADPLDEQLGKHGFRPLHKPGEGARAYMAPMPGTQGVYVRLTEGLSNGPGHRPSWVLTADHIQVREPWTDQQGKPTRKRDMTLEPLISDPNQPKPRAYLPDSSNMAMGEKSVLATGAHPIDDDTLNRAVRDVAQHGRNSQTYQKAVLDTAYEAPKPVRPGPGMTQKDLRGLSFVNPGLSRFAERDPYLPDSFSDESKPAIPIRELLDRDRTPLGVQRTVDPGNFSRLNPSGDALIDFKSMEEAGDPMRNIKSLSPCSTCWEFDGDDYPFPLGHFDSPGHTPMEDISTQCLASAVSD